MFFFDLYFLRSINLVTQSIKMITVNSLIVANIDDYFTLFDIYFRLWIVGFYSCIELHRSADIEMAWQDPWQQNQCIRQATFYIYNDFSKKKMKGSLRYNYYNW